MICLVGRPGIGKTALLARICRRLEHGEVQTSSGEALPVRGVIYMTGRGGQPSLDHRRLFDHAVWVLALDADESLRQVLRDVDQPVARKAEVLLSRMTDGMFVMAIDQLEDLFTPADVIADAQWRDFLEVLLQASHGVRVLTSSRRRMVVSPTAMRGVRLVPIDHGLPEADAVQVLRELDHEGTLGLRNAPESQLRWGVQRVHGMPRALGAIASILANESDPHLRPARRRQPRLRG